MEQWNVGKKITEARTKLGISKRQAAQRAGISEAWWRQLENGWVMKNGHRAPITIPVETIGQMTWVVGINPVTLLDELREAGYPATEEELLRGVITARVKTMNMAALRLMNSFLNSMDENAKFLTK